MKKQVLHIIVNITMLTLLWSCDQVVKEIPDELNPPSAEKVQLELSLRTDEYRTPVLRSLADEHGIDTTSLVLIFSGTDDNAVLVETVQAFALSGIGKHYIMPTKQTGPCRLLILSNPQDSFYMTGNQILYAFTVSKIDSLFNGKTLSYVCANMLTEPLSNPQTSVPYAGNRRIPMSYLQNVTSIDESTPIGTAASPLQMKRVTAKIVIKSDLPDFTFDAVTAVVNAPKQGQLHLLGASLMNNAGGLTEYNAGDSYATDLITATASGSGQTIENDPVYLYESGTPNNTYLIIKGTYKGKTCYYRLFVADQNKNPLNLLRNHQYTIRITSVSGFGYETIDDLKLSAGSTNLNYDVKIVDENSHEIVANENYYLTVSNSVFIAYTDAIGSGGDVEFDMFTVTTDCVVDFQEDNYITHIDTTWGILLTYPTPVENRPGGGQAYKARIPIATNSSVPVATPVKAVLRGYISDTYKIYLKLGDLEKEVHLISKWMSAIPASGDTLTQLSLWSDNYYLLSGHVEGNAKDWIKLMPATNIIRNDSTSIVVDDGKIHICIEQNSSGAERRGIVYFTAIKDPTNDPGNGNATSFRIKVDIAQQEN